MSSKEQEIRAVGIPSAAMMGVAKIGVRDYFTMEHLWNARHNAELCAEREAALVADGFRGIDRAVRAFALAGILESVAFLEALVNSVWQDAVDDDPESPNPNPHLEGLSAQSIARLRELWKTERVERSLSVLDKYQVALTCADQRPINLGEAPGQIVAAIILFRNDLMHFKPKVQWTHEVHRLEDRLRPRLTDNPLLNPNPWFPHHMLSASGAKLAYETSREFGELWWQRMGFVWDHFKTFDEMTAQVPSNRSP
ncbi:hypothetical protein [Mycobacterium branderi]|nr:hypothetical protein [Mycobacterium branderi]MCV7232264.1 hypothetical protein [Mycobacterium branderi]BBZ14284.1 hypothetical protein MBRA_44790 [Mycobacterium branderi]